MYGGSSSSSPPRPPTGTGHHYGRAPPPISTSPHGLPPQQQYQQHQQYQPQYPPQPQPSPYGSSMRQQPRYPTGHGHPYPRTTPPRGYGQPPPSAASGAGGPSPPPGVRFQDDGDTADTPSFLFEDDATPAEEAGPRAERHAVPTEAQLTLLCLDYLRGLRRAYPDRRGEDLGNAEGLDADYVALAAWALSRAFVRWVRFFLLSYPCSPRFVAGVGWAHTPWVATKRRAWLEGGRASLLSWRLGSAYGRFALELLGLDALSFDG